MGQGSGFIPRPAGPDLLRAPLPIAPPTPHAIHGTPTTTGKASERSEGRRGAVTYACFAACRPSLDAASGRRPMRCGTVEAACHATRRIEARARAHVALKGSRARGSDVVNRRITLAFSPLRHRV